MEAMVGCCNSQQLGRQPILSSRKANSNCSIGACHAGELEIRAIAGVPANLNIDASDGLSVVADCHNEIPLHLNAAVYARHSRACMR